jgi:SAM-dependent methyltransferase
MDGQADTGEKGTSIVPGVCPIDLPNGDTVLCRAWMPDARPSWTLAVFGEAGAGLGPDSQLAAWPELDGAAVFACPPPGDPSKAANDAGRAWIATIQQIDLVMRRLAELSGNSWEDTVVAASGAAALAVATWVHDFAPPLRGMVLADPALTIPPSTPLPRGVRLLWKYTAERLTADAGAIRVPTLLFCSNTASPTVQRAHQRFFEQLGAAVKRMRALPAAELTQIVPIGSRPGLALEPPHEAPSRQAAGTCGALCEELRQFLVDASHRRGAPVPGFDTGHYGGDGGKHQRLCTPLAPLSRRGLYYGLVGAGLRAMALFSPGLRLGWRTGFDSGEMLDYVYENRARGIPVLGTWIDRLFLNNIGWKAARRRKQHIEKTLRGAVQAVLATGQPVRVLDIAAGPGRYVLETVRAFRGADISALLRDYESANLEAGRKLAQAMGVENAEFQWGDGFDEASLATISPPPNVAVACGFYELFGDSGRVLCSLRGLAAAVRPGGYLVYTNQPWHPRLEFLARVLVNHAGKPLAMRCRCQEEMDDLVRAAGFHKVGMEIDEFGIFSVSLARRG